MQTRLQEIKEKFKTYDESPLISDDYCNVLPVKDIRWLIKTLETYKKSLMQIGSKCKPPASRIANEVLMKIDLGVD